ncbi:MAG: DUF72 domain-containing protein [Acetobacteraceae bacterium]|nr:DUF72 domain-containing protein [Acetobacteraceae bacterium]
MGRRGAAVLCSVTRGRQIRIGISGWTYQPWRGVFYPKGLPQKRELEYASNQFNSIEINGTFYGMQRPEAFASWVEQTPDDFVFAVKGPRFITHIRRVRDAEIPLANFIASGLLRLGRKLGPILWQFPPSFRFNAERIEAFLALLPHDTQSAAHYACRHDDRLKGRAWLKAEVDQPLRHALEIRHESFRTQAFIDLLRRYDVALVCADTVEWPRLMDVTSDFVYCRLHGSEELYASGYDDTALDVWARRVLAWTSGGEPEDAERIGGPAREKKNWRDVFVYFDNDAKVRAPADAGSLAAKVRNRLG